MAEKHYNLDYLNSISGGDQDFIKDMLETFITNVPADLKKIREWMDSGNWQKVGEDAHKFASSLLFLGLDKLKAIASDIEEMGLNVQNVGKIPDLLDELENGCNELILELKRDFNV